MARSALQARKEAELAKAAATEEKLRARTKQLEAGKVDVDPLEMAGRLASIWPTNVLRPPETFQRTMKTRDLGKIRTAVAMHLFARYPVPRRVQDIWWQTTPEDSGWKINDHYYNRGIPFWEERFACFFAAGAGESVHKTIFKNVLSKMETHRFLSCSFKLDYYQAITWAIARTYADDDAVALSLAHTRLSQADYHQRFWRDAIMFFASQQRVPAAAVGDLCDFLEQVKAQTEATGNVFSFKGRTLASMTRLSEAWHREMLNLRRVGDGSWVGLPIEDWSLFNIKHDTWKATQIVTGKALAAEGSAMRHCVYSYKQRCTAGNTGIFSVSVKRHQSPVFRRALTVEVRGTSMVQARGIANRQPTAEERAVLKKWCDDRNLLFVLAF